MSVSTGEQLVPHSPFTFVLEPHCDFADQAVSRNVRDQARAQLRADLNAKLVQLTQNADARMRWTVDGYARHVVGQHNYKLIFWPDDVPF
ncbi:hypothetical protein PYCCODRAFT_1482031, partial [Trametes coccinea BRFM310]